MVTIVAVLIVLAALLMIAIAIPRRAPEDEMVPVPHETGKPRVVILGGGFAGIYAAAELEKRSRGDFEIVLVNKENHFVFQPLLPEVISGTIGLVDVVSPIRRLLPKTELHVREVESVDLDQRTIT